MKVMCRGQQCGALASIHCCDGGAVDGGGRYGELRRWRTNDGREIHENSVAGNEGIEKKENCDKSKKQGHKINEGNEM
ncbi:hypothetical protein E2C01_046495 [Portunus trituberculatus]|uniref:Uncharacterized protein n=1 Tax=Portunus trituberculatus TaxID=210409 RepID=A0A5B7G168_PORTR|nr:hypothetical protein [Portunus trituberculatus]